MAQAVAQLPIRFDRTMGALEGAGAWERNHTVSRHILERTPLELIVHDPATGRFETLSDVSPLDRIKTASHVGYNVFATASPFWRDVIGRLNGAVTRRMQ